MKEFVGSAPAHGFFFIPQVFNGVFQAFLPLPLLGVLIGSRLLLCCSGLSFRRIGLFIRGIFHRLSTSVRGQDL